MFSTELAEKGIILNNNIVDLPDRRRRLSAEGNIISFSAKQTWTPTLRAILYFPPGLMILAPPGA